MVKISHKVDTAVLGHAHTSQARYRATDHLRPSKLAARIARLVEHTTYCAPPKLSPMIRASQGLVAAVKCCARKARYFRCPGRRCN